MIRIIVSVFVSIATLLSLCSPALAYDEFSNDTQVSVWDGSIADCFAGGDGTEDSPYLIASAAQLAYLAEKVNSGQTYPQQCYELSADIVLDPIFAFEQFSEWRKVSLRYGENCLDLYCEVLPQIAKDEEYLNNLDIIMRDFYESEMNYLDPDDYADWISRYPSYSREWLVDYDYTYYTDLSSILSDRGMGINEIFVACVLRMGYGQDRFYWTPIGTSEHPFEGNFNGSGHKIIGLTVGNSEDQYASDYVTLNDMGYGLFGVANNSCLRDIHMVNSSISVTTDIQYATRDGYEVDRDYFSIPSVAVGTIVGAITSDNGGTSLIESCSSVGGRIYAGEADEDGKAYIGGIAGFVEQTNINGCYNDDQIILDVVTAGSEDYHALGGVMGKVSYCYVSECYYAGTSLMRTDRDRSYLYFSFVGGIVGEADNSSFVSCCNAAMGKQDGSIEDYIDSTANIYTCTFGNGIAGQLQKNTALSNCYFVESAFENGYRISAASSEDSIYIDVRVAPSEKLRSQDWLYDNLGITANILAQ